MRRNALLAGAIALPMALGGVGTAYAAHYQDRALPGSSLGGVAVGGMTREQVADVVRQRVEAATVTIRSGAETRTESLADLGYDVDVDATVEAIFSANGSWSSYARSLVSTREVRAVVRTDEDITDEVVTQLVEQADKVGRDATVALGPKKAKFVVTPAVPGQTVDPATFQDVVAAAAEGLEPATATVSFVEDEPDVTTAAAEQAAEVANAIIARDVSISDGDEAHAASTKTKASWVTIPTEGDVLGAPGVDAGKVKAWVEKVAAEVAVEPTKGLRYLDAAGEVRKVMTEARDGRKVANAPALAGAAVQALSAGKAYDGGFEFDVVDATWEERRIAKGAENLAYPAAEGEKWIDVDLGKHTMTAYVGAKVVYGPVAMVSGAAETPTVTGTYHVYYKNPLMTMRGQNADGSDYETENVPYSTFFHRGYALHGAPWRSSFGYAASHGCVNLPVSIAKWVYDFAPVGTPVTTHF
ncbi:L,D-transpeptidase/peptidoglycan binding protein [Phycicoccus sp. CSK15P-2]|uniref:L,D-transpeptidase family protein n=1 Tax=Phycicoccus sp. CSK15P-2 TaxID=2807627 RepID=UPI00194F442D|nr:L,D-transpeptidase family protein [Phycicoccus sp. CSK15P-2]MBM6406018.1 L,D-transpeptidase/peptidoglycan binding protein [Phycicoccus sp. CSK15P-2]